MNRWPTNPGVMERATLERLTGIGPVLGLLPDHDGIDTRRPRGLPADFALVDPRDATTR